MLVEEPDVSIVGQLDQGAVEQTSFKIETLAGSLPQVLVCLTLRVRALTEVKPFNIVQKLLMKSLPRDTRVMFKRGAHRLTGIHDILKRLLKNIGIYSTLERKGNRHVVQGIVGLKPLARPDQQLAAG